MDRGNKIVYIHGIGTTSAEAQTMLDAIVQQDQWTFYTLNVTKTKLQDVIDEYNYGNSDLTAAEAQQAQSLIAQINTELIILGTRQEDLSNQDTIQVQFGLDDQFAEFISNVPINGIAPQRIGRIGQILGIIIVVAIIATVIAIDEIISYLKLKQTASSTSVEHTKILQQGAANLNPQQQEQYWADIQRQIDSNYKAGESAGSSSLLGVLNSALKMVPWIIGGALAIKLLDLFPSHKSQST